MNTASCSPRYEGNTAKTCHILWEAKARPFVRVDNETMMGPSYFGVVHVLEILIPIETAFYETNLKLIMVYLFIVMYVKRVNRSLYDNNYAKSSYHLLCWGGDHF